ncbi:MAG TPA: DUF5330 domain-containing protein [Xanthobacteraceae bacterium]|jgi:hypothetical protein
MRFLLRLGFWLALVLVVLPRGGSQLPTSVNLSAGEAMSAAKATVTDVGSFCERQRDACTVGSQAAAVIGQRAQAGAKVLYGYLRDHMGAAGAASPAGGAPSPAAHPSQHTLLPADKVPAWRAPQPYKDARINRAS